MPVPEGWLGNGELQVLRGRDVDRCGFGTATWISSVTGGGHTWLLDSTRDIHAWKGCARPTRVGRVQAYFVRSLEFDGGLQAVFASGVSVALDAELRPLGTVPVARGEVVDVSDDGAYAWMGGDGWGAGIDVARRETIRVTGRRSGDFVPGTHRVDIGSGEWADLDGRGGELPRPWTGIDDDIHDPDQGYFPARCLGGGSDCPPRFDPTHALLVRADAPGERCWFVPWRIESDTSEVDDVSMSRWRLNQFGWEHIAIVSAFAPVRTTAGTLAVVGSALVRLEDGRAMALPDGVQPRSFVGSPTGTTLAFTSDDALYIASVAGLQW